jgi:hypothetical protein
MRQEIIMGRRETLLRYCEKLQGLVGLEGWVSIHNNSLSAQASSNDCIARMRDAGYNFDIETVNGIILTDVDINDARVKAVYNVNSNLETLPPNGIKRWRIASEFPARGGVCPPIVDYKTTPKPAPLPGTEGWNIDKPGCMSADEALRQAFSQGPLTQKELYEASLEPDRGPFYANDKYKREIKPGVFIDVYDVIDCYEVTSGALQHALKKILAAGKRGHKDYEQDLIDILASVERALFQHQEKKK